MTTRTTSAGSLLAAATPRFVRATIYHHPDGGATVTTPRGRTFREALETDELAAILNRFDGTRTTDQALAGCNHELVALVAMLYDQGCLSDHGYPGMADYVRFDSDCDPAVPRNTRLALLGDPQLVRLASIDSVSGTFRSVQTLSGIDAVSDLDPAEYLLVALTARFNPQLLRRADTAAQRQNIRWTHFHFETEAGWFGPHRDGPQGPDSQDLLARRAAAASDAAAVRAFSEP